MLPGEEPSSDVCRGRRRVCGSRNDCRNQRFCARRAQDLPESSRRHAASRAGSSRRRDLPELGEKLGAYAQRKLSERKVEVCVNTKVTGVTDRSVELSDGTVIYTNTLVWTAGTSANPLLQDLPCRKDRGRIVVNEYLEVCDWTNVWALGDYAAIPDPKTGAFYPPTAQHALRQGKTLARNLVAAIRGGNRKPFVFSTIGQLAAIGRRTGVANIFGINFSGFIAWWLWRTIYLSKLPRFEKNVRVALDWTLDLVFSKDLVQFLEIKAPDVSRREETASSVAVTKAAAGD